ncbi:MAG TPA: YdiU family protein [Candidatus Elarobacter sp.]
MAIAPPRSRTLEELRFENTFAALGDTFSELRAPTGIPNARLVAFSPAAATLLALRPGEETRPEFLALTSGNAVLPGMEPVAGIYGGHQFGVWAGQLGDGRAILLGEARDDENRPIEMQIKGGGMTAFSRFADGRAVIRSTVREFLASEAIDALGIPTTRALAMAAGDEPVLRERIERAATLIRLAPSFIRFGSFEIFHYRKQFEAVKTLADYVIGRFYPRIAALDERERYARFLDAVVERTAILMAEWQAIGFAHGVMNTDNFSILGLTLDYGPYGFIEAYDPGFICNHTDELGRYAFDRQPTIGLWNCHALAAALSSLIAEDERTAALAHYESAFWTTYLVRMSAKLGLDPGTDGNTPLVEEIVTLLAQRRVDWTNFWRALSHDDAAALALLCDDETSRAWFARYAEAKRAEGRTDEQRHAAMLRTNPKYVLRNWIAQQAIEACEAGDDTVVRAVYDVLRAPYDEHPERADWAKPAPPQYAHLEVSCSS